MKTRIRVAQADDAFALEERQNGMSCKKRALRTEFAVAIAEFTDKLPVHGEQLERNRLNAKRTRKQTKHASCNLIKALGGGASEGKIVEHRQAPQMAG